MDESSLRSAVQHSDTSEPEDAGRRALFRSSGVGVLVAAGAIATFRTAPAEANTATGWYNLKDDFDAAGDGTTDDTPAWLSAIANGSQDQRPVFVPPGAYRITQALQIPSNTMIVGSSTGLGFGCRLEPENCAAFDIGGSTQSFHCAIENLMIWPKGTAAPDHIISIDNSYSVRLRNIRIHNAPADLQTAAIKLLGDPAVGGHGACNDILWENLIVRNDAGQPPIAILASRGCGTHRFVKPDLEMYVDLLDWRGGQIELIAPYTERAGRYSVNCGVDSADTLAYLNTYGGTIVSAESGIPCAIRATTRNFNSFGTKWRHPSSYAVYVYGVPSLPATFHGLVPNVSSAGASRFGGVSGWQAALSFPDYLLRKSASWTTTVPSGSQTSTTVSVAGVQVGHHWSRAIFSSSLGGATLSSHVSASDVVTVVAQNNTASAIPLSGTLLIECGWCG